MVTAKGAEDTTMLGTGDDPPDGILAIIPARGGSKSIPRKNIKRFCGRPLIEWSIAAAQSAQSVQRIIVSTDDEDIRAVAIASGAEAPFVRPAALAQDDTTDLPVVVHTLDWLATHDRYRPTAVVQLRPTSPVRPHGLVDAAVAKLCTTGSAHSLRAVALAAQNPYKMWRIRGDMMTPLLQHEGHEPFNQPRQSLPETFWQTGHVDVMRTETVHRGSLTGSSIAPIIVDARYAIDLDTEDQWHQAEHVTRAHRSAIVWPQIGRTLLSRYRLLALDFDGVLTDNTVTVHTDGDESVRCDRSDGLGIAALRDRGFPIVVLSTETHPVVAARCRKLGIPCQQGLSDKGAALRAYAANAGVSLDETIYVGNDVNDLACLRMAGLAVVPADAKQQVIGEADWILSQNGGRGAVRELCDALMEALTA